jgi:hypothetical protein
MIAQTSDERELLLRYLHRQREHVVATAAGLSEAQLRWTPDGRLLPIIGVINHLTRVEWRWINGRYLAEPFPARGEEFVVDDGVSGVSVVDAYWRRAQETDRLVRAAPGLTIACLGREGAGPAVHDVLGIDDPVDLRWILLHLIEETAHHAGHADATREMLDGTRMDP